MSAGLLSSSWYRLLPQVHEVQINQFSVWATVALSGERHAGIWGEQRTRDNKGAYTHVGKIQGPYRRNIRSRKTNPSRILLCFQERWAAHYALGQEKLGLTENKQKKKQPWTRLLFCCPTRIRTLASRTKIWCATITPWDNRLQRIAPAQKRLQK